MNIGEKPDLNLSSKNDVSKEVGATSLNLVEILAPSIVELARVNPEDFDYEIREALKELSKVKAILHGRNEVKLVYDSNEVLVEVKELNNHSAIFHKLWSLGVLNSNLDLLNKVSFIIAKKMDLNYAIKLLETKMVKGYVEALRSIVRERWKSLQNMDEEQIFKSKGSLAYWLTLKLLENTIPYYIRPEKGQGKGIFMVYKNGVYVEGEDYLKSKAISIANEYGVADKVTKVVLNNMLEHIKAICIEAMEKRDLEKGLYIAFENGLLDIDEYLKTGVLKLKEFNPNIRVYWKIPHRLDIEKYEKLSEEAKKDPVKALKEIDPELYRVFKEWVTVNLNDPNIPEEDREFAKLIYDMVGNVDNIVKLILQIIGNTLLPDIRYDFMTILYSKETLTAKSTLLLMIASMLGWENVSSIPLQELAENTFSRIGLLGKLANIYTDLPKRRVKNQGVLKQIISGEPISADVKHKCRIKFRPIAKHFYSCNKLPSMEDIEDRAYLRRILIIPFLRKFKRNEEYKKYLMRKGYKLIIPSLIALREMLTKGIVLDPVDVVDKIREFWKMKTDPIYKFLKEMVEKGILKLDSEGKVEDNDLLELYNEWAEKVGEDTLDMGTLTRRLKEHRIRKVTIHGYGYYKGVKLLKPLKEAKKTLEEYLEGAPMK